MVGAGNIIFATKAKSVWGPPSASSNEQQGQYYPKTAEACGWQHTCM